MRFRNRTPLGQDEAPVIPGVHRRKQLVLVRGFPEGSLLILGGLFLMLGLPFLVRHAVDRLSALVLAHRHAVRIGRILHPVGQAVAAEAGEVHEIDVLHVGARAQVLEQPAERGRLELGARLLVDCGVAGHGCGLLKSLAGLPPAARTMKSVPP